MEISNKQQSNFNTIRIEKNQPAKNTVQAELDPKKFTKQLTETINSVKTLIKTKEKNYIPYLHPDGKFYSCTMFGSYLSAQLKKDCGTQLEKFKEELAGGIGSAYLGKLNKNNFKQHLSDITNEIEKEHTMWTSGLVHVFTEWTKKDLKWATEGFEFMKSLKTFWLNIVADVKEVSAALDIKEIIKHNEIIKVVTKEIKSYVYKNENGEEIVVEKGDENFIFEKEEVFMEPKQIKTLPELQDYEVPDFVKIKKEKQKKKNTITEARNFLSICGEIQTIKSYYEEVFTVYSQQKENVQKLNEFTEKYPFLTKKKETILVVDSNNSIPPPPPPMMGNMPPPPPPFLSVPKIAKANSEVKITSLSTDMVSYHKVLKNIEEKKNQMMKILFPDLNAKDYDFSTIMQYVDKFVTVSQQRISILEEEAKSTKPSKKEIIKKEVKDLYPECTKVIKKLFTKRDEYTKELSNLNTQIDKQKKGYARAEKEVNQIITVMNMHSQALETCDSVEDKLELIAKKQEELTLKETQLGEYKAKLEKTEKKKSTINSKFETFKNILLTKATEEDKKIINETTFANN